MKTDLHENPHVLGLADILAKDVLHIIGMLWRVWSWADSQSLDGNAVNVTEATLDRFTQCVGFAAALRKVGWLEGRDAALTFPRFAEHNGQTSKARAVTAKRVADFKNRRRHPESNADGNGEVTVTPLPREEKRREEIHTPPTPPVGGEGEKCPDSGADSPPETPSGGELRPETGRNARSPATEAPETQPGTGGQPTPGPMPEKQRKPRPRNPLFDALAAATEGDPDALTKQAASAVGQSIAAIRAVCPDVSPDEINRRAANYRAHMPPGAMLTARALARHWAICAKPPDSTTQSRPPDKRRAFFA